MHSTNTLNTKSIDLIKFNNSPQQLSNAPAIFSISATANMPQPTGRSRKLLTRIRFANLMEMRRVHARNHPNTHSAIPTMATERCHSSSARFELHIAPRDRYLATIIASASPRFRSRTIIRLCRSGRSNRAGLDPCDLERSKGPSGSFFIVDSKERRFRIEIVF